VEYSSRMSAVDSSTGTNSSVIVASSLSIVSILGFVGTCLMNHKDTILEKMRCWVGWGTEKNDEEHTVDLEARGSTEIPRITLPIVINNHSGEMTLAPQQQPVATHRRSHSEPTFDTSTSDYDYNTSPTRTSSSSDIVCR